MPSLATTAATKHALVEEYRRDSIQKAARRVIARRGLAGASMQAIASEAGVAKGTLYLYFRDREDLVEHAAERIFDELLQRLGAVLAEPRPLRETLPSLLRTKLAFFDENQEFLRVYVAFHDAAGTSAHLRRRKRPQYARYLELLGAHLAQAARHGEMKSFDPGRVALFVAEGTSAILRQRLQEPSRRVEDDAKWIEDMLLFGLSSGGRS
jgi:AcrR family transcriptional regulator